MTATAQALLRGTSDAPRQREVGQKSAFDVITFNVFVGPPAGRIDVPRFRRLASMLRERQADVYCLQEVFSDVVIGILRSELEPEYHVLYGRASSLRVALRRAAAAVLCLGGAALCLCACGLASGQGCGPAAQAAVLLAAAALCWTCWTHTQQTVGWAFAFGGANGGLVTLCRRASVHVRSTRYQDFEEQGADFLNVARARGFLTARVHVRGTDVALLNVHTNAFPTVSMRNALPIPSAERRAQLEQAFGCASRIGCKEAKEAVVVLGDFNTSPGDGEIPTVKYNFTSALPLDKSTVTLPITPKLLQVFPETRADMCADYQFFRGVSLMSAEVLRTCDLSDHLPVRATYCPQ